MANVLLVGNEELEWEAESTLSNDMLITERFVALESGTLKTINVTALASGNAMVALYSNNVNVPGNVLVASGSTAVTVGVNAISVSDTEIVEGTTYWLAANSDDYIIRLKSGGGVYTWLKFLTGQTYSGFTFPDNPSMEYNDDDLAALSGWGEVAAAGGSPRCQVIII